MENEKDKQTMNGEANMMITWSGLRTLRLLMLRYKNWTENE